MMFIGQWRAQLIVDPPGMMGAVLYLYQKLDATHMQFLCADGTIKTVPRGSVPVGTDFAFATFEGEQLTAVAEAFSNAGVKTVNEHKIEGLLQAKEDHLQDMRKLVFKEPTK